MENEQRVALVTGAAGYLGSHLCKRLKKEGWFVIGLDLLHSQHHYWDRWWQSDVTDKSAVESVFVAYKVDIVFHFAGRIEVGESVKNPTEFWHTNTAGTITVLNAMKKFGNQGCDKIIFSSTAGVYFTGSPSLAEHEITTSNNPYAGSKIAAENAIQESGLKYVIFRFFNLAGADSDGELGEDHYPETHLIPRILQNLNTFEVYGDNYRTVDGTAERDYVHVEDVVDANIEAIKYLDDGSPSEIINLGNGVGYTVLEVIQTVKLVSGQSVNYTLKAPREGDPDILVADILKARRLLNFKPKHDIASIVQSAYGWEKKRKRYR